MAKITLIPCASSHIKAHGFDPDADTLRIEFVSGKTFDYSGVDAAKYGRFCASDSLGKFFHAEIKGQHQATPVTAAAADDTQ